MESDRGTITLVNSAFERGYQQAVKDYQHVYTPQWEAWPEYDIGPLRLRDTEPRSYIIQCSLMGRWTRTWVSRAQAELMTPEILRNITQRLLLGIVQEVWG